MRQYLERIMSFIIELHLKPYKAIYLKCPWALAWRPAVFTLATRYKTCWQQLSIAVEVPISLVPYWVEVIVMHSRMCCVVSPIQSRRYIWLLFVLSPIQSRHYIWLLIQNTVCLWYHQLVYGVYTIGGLDPCMYNYVTHHPKYRVPCV